MNATASYDCRGSGGLVAHYDVKQMCTVCPFCDGAVDVLDDRDGSMFTMVKHRRPQAQGVPYAVDAWPNEDERR